MTEPGLDPAALRAIRGRQQLHTRLLDRIATHLDRHGGFVAWSGGKDSTAIVDLARRADPHVPVVFYDCGLEYPDTLGYISELATRWDLNLTIIKTSPDLLTLLVAAGDFDPSAETRPIPYSLRDVLIHQPAARAHNLFGPGSLWGVRAAESTGRRHLYATSLAREITHTCATCCTTSGAQRDTHGGVIRRGDGTTTFGPIWNWTHTAVLDYLAARDIPLNPIYATLEHLGLPAEHARVDAIIDPTHLRDGQIGRLQYGWPDLYDRLTTALPRLTDFA